MTFVADGAPWIWERLDWVIAQVKLDPNRVVEVLDWCHAVHHLSVALAALPTDRGASARGFTSGFAGSSRRAKART